MAQATGGKARQVLEKLTAWRDGIRLGGLVLMGLAPFFVWESSYGYGYLSGEYWSYGVPVNDETRGFAHPAGLFSLLLLGLVLGVRRMMRGRTPRRREAICIGLAALAWFLVVAGTGSSISYTPGGVEMSTTRGAGATMAAWGAFLVLAASVLAFRAHGRADAHVPAPAPPAS